MVLKIDYKDGWQFVDKIKEIFVTPINVVKFAEDKEQNRNFDEVFFTNMDIVGNKIVPRPEGTPTDSKICEVVVLMNNGEYKRYLADLAIYLLSDEGKTIERIN